MQLFDITEAQHFCAPLGTPLPGVGQSLSAFHGGLPARHILLQEGSMPFTVHQVSLMHAVERWILFGVADYRRALDMFIPSNAPWAHVTLYYASFFGANAILGMFGGWMDHKRMVEVDQGTPGAQVLRVSKKLRSPSGFRGSHKVFWDNFYEGCNSKIGPWVPAEYQPAVAPVNGDRAWQITTRNEVNYDMHGAFTGAKFLDKNFNPKRLGLLAGSIGQQLAVTEGMLRLAIYFANHFGVQSFAYDGLGTGPRGRVFRELVTRTTPRLVEQSAIRHLMFQ
jgi:hypothetical protein